MPVTYQPYQSMFVDRKSPEISQMLNQRYLENYTAQTTLQDQLAALQAAPFEGDQKARNELIQQTQKQLNQLTERGDYENLTMPVMQAAQSYNKKAQPIMQNYQAYQSYATSLKEAYDEEKLDYEDYMGTLALAKQKYSGLTYDAQGNATNFFSGLDPVYNPNIQERMHDALNGIVAEEFGQGARIVGMNSAAGVIQVMVEGEVKTVSSDRVTSVMDMVMSDPQVTAYLDRKGAIQASAMSETDLAKFKVTRMGQIQESLTKVQEAIGKSTDPEERAQLERMAANLIENAGIISGMNTPQQLRAFAATERAKQLEATYRNAAQSRYGYRSVTRDTSIAPQWMQAVAGNGGLGASSIYSAVPGAITQVSNPDGSTVDAITGSIANYASMLTQLEDPEYMQQQYSIPLSGSEILNMSTQEFVERFPTVDVALFNKAKSAITTATAMKTASERRVSEVRTELGIEPEQLIENIKSSVVGGEELISAISTGLGISEIEAVDLLNYRFSRETPGPAGLFSTIIGALMDAGKPDYVDPNQEALDKLDQILFGSSDGSAGRPLNKFGGRSLGAIFNEIEHMYKGDLNKMDEYLEENSTTTTSMPVITTIPFYMSETERKNLTGFLSAGNAAVAANAYLDATGSMVSFDLAVESVIPLQPNAEGFNTSTAKLKSSAFAPYNLSGTGGTMQMTYEDENGKTVVVAMPFSAIDNPGINRYEASEYAKFAAIVGAQRARQVKNIVVPAYGGDGTRYEIRVNINESGGASTATMVDMNGNVLRTSDFDTMLKPGGPIDALIKNGGRIDYI